MEEIARRGLIHRDLALRNVLVFAFSPVDPHSVRVKVADYGLTQDRRGFHMGNNAFPFRWMPPESIRRRLWSEKSDVWAFGVLMWELWSAGKIPWPHTPDSTIAKIVTNGERLSKPTGCPNKVYELVKRCWAHQADERPVFCDLRTELESLVSRAGAMEFPGNGPAGPQNPGSRPRTSNFSQGHRNSKKP
mmetsp:Transcript_31539/g.74965  ORF Transcript_31539/g.74965 Transcript_31539/m.74965 type:complete len:190 (-) Transcript_31539:415-984(-)